MTTVMTREARERFLSDLHVGVLSVGRDDFENQPILYNAGGWGRANRAFGEKLAELIGQINEAIAA